jgi:hypothetical protein
MPLGFVDTGKNFKFVTSRQVEIHGYDGVKGEITSDVTGLIDNVNNSIELAISPPWESDELTQNDNQPQEIGYDSRHYEKHKKNVAMTPMQRNRFYQADIDRDAVSKEDLKVSNVYGDVKIIVRDPDVQIRVLMGNKKIDGNAPEEANKTIAVTSFQGNVEVDYRPANKPQVKDDVPEDEREMAEVLAEVERVLDSRVDLNTLKQLREGLGNINAPDVHMAHMQMLGERIARKEHELVEQQFNAAFRLHLPPHLIDRGKDIIVDMAHERELPPQDELLVNLLDNLKDAYKAASNRSASSRQGEVANESEDATSNVANKDDLDSLFKKIKRLGRRKNGSHFVSQKMTSKYSDEYGTVRFPIGETGNDFSFTEEFDCEKPDGKVLVLKDPNNERALKIIGDVVRLHVNKDWQIQLIGNVQKIEAYDDAVVEVEGKVAAAVAVDSSEVYASGRIKRKRQFGESVIREYDQNLESYD